MIKKILKILIYFLLVILVSFFEISFLKTLGKPFNYLQIILTISIFTTLFFGINRSLIWFVLGGYLLDLYSPFPFGLALISILIAILIVRGLSLWHFVPHTVYSLIILTMIGTAAYHVCFFLLNKLTMFLNKSATLYNLNFSEICWYIVANVCLSILIFIIFKQISKRFRISLL